MCSHSNRVNRTTGQTVCLVFATAHDGFVPHSFPFKYPIVCAMLDFGGTLNNTWMWQDIACPAKTSTSRRWQS